MMWKSRPLSLKSLAEKPEIPTDDSWPWRPTLPFMQTNMPMKHKPWFSSIGYPKNKEKPLPRLGSPSLKTNMLQTQTRPGPRSRKPLKLHSPPMTQQCKCELPLLHLTKTGRTPQDLTNISPYSSSSLSTPKSLTTTPCQNGFFAASTYRSQYSLLFLKQSKPPPPWRNFTPKPLRSKEATTASPHLGEDPNHSMEEVVVTTTPMLWTWITLCYS